MQGEWSDDPGGSKIARELGNFSSQASLIRALSNFLDRGLEGLLLDKV